MNTAPPQVSTATAERYAKLLERLDAGANHRDYPEAFGGSWTQLCLEAAGAIRTLCRAAAQGSLDRGNLARKFCKELCGQEVCTDEGNWLCPQSPEGVNEWCLDLADIAIADLTPAHPTQGGDKGEAVAWQKRADEMIMSLGCIKLGVIDQIELRAAFLKLMTWAAAPQPASNAYPAPEGWKLVPLIPDESMIEVGCENNSTQWNEGTDLGFAADVANDVYVSMVRAAPSPVSSTPSATPPDWKQDQAETSRLAPKLPSTQEKTP